MALQGSLKTMSVSDVLQFLAVGKKTGLLKISRAKVLKGIYFENGTIVGSSTNDPKEYLGQVLIHYGKIDEAQLQTAMEIQRSEAASQRSEAQRSEAAASNSKSKAGRRKDEAQRPKAKSQSPRRLGQILVSEGMLTEADIAKGV